MTGKKKPWVYVAVIIGSALLIFLEFSDYSFGKKLVSIITVILLGIVIIRNIIQRKFKTKDPE